MDQKKELKGIGCVMPSIVIGVFIIWFFFIRDQRTAEQKITDAFEEKASRARLDEKISQSRNDIYRDVISDIEKELDRKNINYSNVEISENQFVWVYISDNVKDGDYLSNLLCVRAKKHFMKGVTLYNSQGKTIGQSVCK